MLNQSNRYYIYARKSSESEDRQVASIDAQINELKKLAIENGLRVVKVFSEAMSAKSPGRPVFNKMLELISADKAEGIICWKLDRLSRNPPDSAQISWLLQRSEIQHIQTYGRSYYPSDNVLMMAVEQGMANQYIRDLSTNVKRGLRAKLEKGDKPGIAPMGYRNTKLAEKGSNTVEPDPERFDLVRQMWDLMLTGHRPPQIWDKMNELGFRTPPTKKKPSQPLGKNTLYQIFHNHFYYGVFYYNGEKFQGKHVPMVTEAEFKRVQELLGKPQSTHHQKYVHKYVGPIRCGGCGLLITAENRVKTQKNGNVWNYTYYHCTKSQRPRCSQPLITEKDLETEFYRLLGEVEISPRFRDWAFSKMQKMNEQESAGRRGLLASQRKAYDECVNKISGLIDMRAAKEIDEETFKEKSKTLLAQKERLHEALNGTDELVSSWVKRAGEAFDFATLARERFEKASPEKRKEFLMALSEDSNLLLTNKRLTFAKASPLFVIREAVKDSQVVKPTFEPHSDTTGKRKNTSEKEMSLLWLGRQDSNLRPID